MKVPRILVVDDKPTILALVERILGETYRVTTVTDGPAAIERICNETFDLVLSDIRMPGASGMEVLGEIKRRVPDLMVILMTGFVTISDAVEAIKMGAYDYIPKPFEPDELRMKVARALDYKRLRDETEALNAALGKVHTFERLIGKSEGMVQTFARLRKAAYVDLPVLLQGEVGTGKELVARAMHHASPRRLARFIAIDCLADRDANELEDAVTSAQSGTVFFADVGELSPTGQGRVYRTLHTLSANNVRLVSASRHDLHEQVEKRLFREDLYYSFKVISVHLPPLRQRREDIFVLVQFFLGELAQNYDVSPDALKQMMMYDWPGNVAELRNVVESAAAVCNGTIMRDDLPAEIQQPSKIMTLPEQSLAVLTYREAVDLLKERATREYLEALMRHTQGNVSRASLQAGLARETLHRLLKKFDIVPETFRRDAKV